MFSRSLYFGLWWTDRLPAPAVCSCRRSIDLTSHAGRSVVRMRNHRDLLPCVRVRSLLLESVFDFHANHQPEQLTGRRFLTAQSTVPELLDHRQRRGSRRKAHLRPIPAFRRNILPWRCRCPVDESLWCFARKISYLFDRIDLRRDLRQHSSLISGAGPNLQHSTIRIELEQLSHPRDDERLRDRLVRADRQRMISISAALQCFRNGEMTRHTSHRVEYSRIVDTVMFSKASNHALSRDGVFLE